MIENNNEQIKTYSYEITLTSRDENGLVMKAPLKYRLLSIDNNKETIKLALKDAFEKMMLAFDFEFDDKIGE